MSEHHNGTFRLAVALHSCFQRSPSVLDPLPWLTSVALRELPPASAVHRAWTEISQAATPSQAGLEADHIESFASEDYSNARDDTLGAMTWEAGIGENFRPGLSEITAPSLFQPYRNLVLEPDWEEVWRRSDTRSRSRRGRVRKPLAFGSSSNSESTVASGSGGTLRSCLCTRWRSPAYLPRRTKGSPKEHRIPSPRQRKSHRETRFGRVFPPIPRSR